MERRKFYQSEPGLRQINESEKFIHETETFTIGLNGVIEIEGNDEEKEFRAEVKSKRVERVRKTLSLSSNLVLKREPSIGKIFGFISNRNICYMNTGLQCLYNCEFFNEYLAGLHIVDKQSLLYHYESLLKSIMGRTEPCIPNWSFQLTFEKLHPEFKKHIQNDCHEFVSLTVNKLHEDLMKEDLAQVEPIESSGEKNWENFLMRNRTIIADNMFGLFLITRVCCRCEAKVDKYEPFLMIDVNPPSQEERSIEVILVYEDNKRLARRFYFTANEHSLARDIKAEISSKEAVPSDHVIIAVVSNRDVYKMVVSDEEHINHHSILFAYIYSRADYIIVESLHTPDAKFPKAKLSYNSYPRLIPIDKTWSLSHLYREVFRHYYEILHPETSFLVEEEFRRHFPRVFGEEGGNLLRLRFINKSNQKVSLFPEKPCSFCHDSCFNCEIPCNEDSVESLYNIAEELPVTLEMIWNRRTPGLRNYGEPAMDSVNTQPQISIEECLERVSCPETLRIFCETCGTNTTQTMITGISRYPKTLLIHIKRFDSSGRKNNRLVKFTKENLRVDPLTGDYYDLIAVANHTGEQNGGHYTAFKKDLESQNWYCIDSENIKRLNDSEVATKSAYLLFYQKKVE